MIRFRRIQQILHSSIDPAPIKIEVADLILGQRHLYCVKTAERGHSISQRSASDFFLSGKACLVCCVAPRFERTFLDVV